MFNPKVLAILAVSIRLASSKCCVTNVNTCDIGQGPGNFGGCVPLDSNNKSQDCHNVFGFIPNDPKAGAYSICEQKYGPEFQNVLLDLSYY